jgi:hypothetical protein
LATFDPLAHAELAAAESVTGEERLAVTRSPCVVSDRSASSASRVERPFRTSREKSSVSPGTDALMPSLTTRITLRGRDRRRGAPTAGEDAAPASATPPAARRLRPRTPRREILAAGVEFGEGAAAAGCDGVLGTRGLPSRRDRVGQRRQEYGRGQAPVRPRRRAGTMRIRRIGTGVSFVRSRANLAHPSPLGTSRSPAVRPPTSP